MEEEKNTPQNSEEIKSEQNESEDSLIPEEKAEKLEKPKKKHRLRTFLIVILVIFLLFLIGVSATGLYDVPVLSSIMGTNKPKDLGVETSPEAVVSISQKIPMKISGEYVSYANTPISEIFTGEVEVDAEFNSEETTSWLERFEGNDPIFDNVQVKKGDGEMEISAMMQKYVKAPVYIKFAVNQTGINQVDLDFMEGRFGKLNVPEKYLQQAEEFFEENVNDLMERIPGFTMEEYKIENGKSYLKGTYPTNARPTNEGWGGLFNL